MIPTPSRRARPGLIDIAVVPTGESGLNPYLQVFDASGHRIAANDNANPSTSASELVFPAYAGQLYHIVVSGHGNQASISRDTICRRGAPETTPCASGPCHRPSFSSRRPRTRSTPRGRRHDRRGPHRLALRNAHGRLLDRWRFGGPGADFLPVSGTLVFGPGVSYKTFTVTIFNRMTAPGDRQLSIVLGSPSPGGTLAPSVPRHCPSTWQDHRRR